MLGAGVQRDRNPGAGEQVRHRVITVAPIQNIVASAGVEHVIQGIAGGVGSVCTSNSDVFQIGPQRITRQCAVHRIDAADPSIAVGLDHTVCHVIDVIAVGAVATFQQIATGSAVQNVVAAVTRDHVFQRIAGAVDGRHAG